MSVYIQHSCYLGQLMVSNGTKLGLHMYHDFVFISSEQLEYMQTFLEGIQPPSFTVSSYAFKPQGRTSAGIFYPYPCKHTVFINLKGIIDRGSTLPHDIPWSQRDIRGARLTH